MNVMIEVKQVSYSYQTDKTTSDTKALNDVSFHINKGEWVAIVGHNGSGKSTTAKLLNGLLIPDKGTIHIDGIPLNQDTIWDIRQHVGMVFQNPENQFVGATVQDDVAFGLENQGVPLEEMKKRVKEALRLVGMWEFKDREPSRLSGGQKQRVAIASVLALRPKVIILDEATAMLDPKGRLMVMETVQQLRKEFGLTIVSITHDVEEAGMADRLFVMNKGQLLHTKEPKLLFSQAEEMAILGLDIPFSETVRLQLEKEGIAVPKEYMTISELEEWLCQSILNK
ncbi:energy-coupling factor ABC transporter ATP-binding protein [Granulicatella sp. 19428wC4_WM01]|nr:energy-coupling factor ABC transporter ATP-binding protein [Granulicatella sp. WM01]MBF0780699.1 energy-coupling factor ABC transporter ATP-binding protein [Granulicatella sp. 19428wC4_WM01]TFU94221.1 energy-coupling factor ABC transporter ATP-binding protein [Granulicatella sp. WM01]